MPRLKNPRHEAFALAVAKGVMKPEAYQQVYGQPNRRQAAISGAHLAKKPLVAARIYELQAEQGKIQREAERRVAEHRVEVQKVSTLSVTEEYRRIGFAKLKDVVGWDGTKLTVKSFGDIPEEVHSAIASIKQTKDGLLEVKMHSKTAALDSLARTLGMFVDRSEVTVRHIDEMTPEELDAYEADIEKRLKELSDSATRH